jgi:hypothetical protein
MSGSLTAVGLGLFCYANNGTSTWFKGSIGPLSPTIWPHYVVQGVILGLLTAADLGPSYQLRAMIRCPRTLLGLLAVTNLGTLQGTVSKVDQRIF